MSLSHQLAGLALALTYDDLPASAQDRCKWLLLDALGVAIAAADEPGVVELSDLLTAWGGRPDATAWMHREKMPAPHAAMLNSVMVHALDLDDVHLPATLHILSSVAPTAIACGQLAKTDGKTVLAAIVAGVEVAARLGTAYETLRQHEGFLPSSIIGGFGATATACFTLGLDVPRTVNAFGIFYAQACGNRQALHDRTLTKRMQPGFAARDAAWAAELARRGVTGAAHCFEGTAGLFRIYGAQHPPAEQQVLDDRPCYEIERVSVKRFPSCGATHRAILATLHLVHQHRISAADIAAIEVGLGAASYHYVGQPFQMGRDAVVQAQFSADYCVALAAVHGEVSFRQFTPEHIRQDTATLDMLGRVNVRAEIHRIGDQPMPPDKYDEPQTVVIHTLDGRKHACGKTYPDVLSPEATSPQSVIRKFREIASHRGALASPAIDRLIDVTLSLDTVSSIDDFVTEHLANN